MSWTPFSLSPKSSSSPSSKSSSSPSSKSSDSPSSWRKKQSGGYFRKSRHAGDEELGLNPAKSSPVSPARAALIPWSKSAAHLPQPLPLPELKSASSAGEHFRSPDSPFNAAVSSNRAFEITRRKSSGDALQRPSKSPAYRRRGFANELLVEGIRHDFDHHRVPIRSAPGSGFSSPALSPQRFRTMDHSSTHSSFRLDPLHKDKFTSERMMYSPEHSPLQSPMSQNSGLNTRKHTSNSSCPKPQSEGWLENGCPQVHPLPLPPPGVGRSSQTASTSQYVDKADVSPVKAQWKKGKLIGRGTFGSVYVATNSKTGALCAMKEVDLIPEDSKAAESIKQLEQEIKVLRQLKHPNVVHYLGCETIEDRFCIYLEYIHPGPINRFVTEHFGAMTECVVRSFTRHITSGLAYLHSKKIIHRDIKGANLLVDANGVVKLADFGLAKHLTACANDLSLKGSPHWMAPEVLQAAMRKDNTSQLAFGVDIWSLGCTVIEMLTGKPPWSDYNGVQAMFRVLNKSPPIPDTLSPEGKEFLQLCFQRRPADRPSAAKLLDHPFLRPPNDNKEANCTPDFSGLTLIDKVQSPDRPKRKKDLMSFLPKISTSKSREQSQNNSENRQIGPKVPDGVPSSRHSPRSTLEGLFTVSSPELYPPNL